MALRPDPQVQPNEGGLIHLPNLISDEFGVSALDASRLCREGVIKIDGEVQEDNPLDIDAEALRGKIIAIDHPERSFSTRYDG